MNNADTKIAGCIEARQSFLLDAGAGAGKTYSLVQALKLLLRSHRSELKAKGQQIGCITFTNVAKDQIAERIENDPLVRVSTIHDFLWDLIAPHQRALRLAVSKYNASLKDSSRRKVEQASLKSALQDVSVTYADLGTNLLKGRLFHDDLLQVAQIMFEDNPMLAQISVAKFPFLFIDEYQDTSKPVVEIVLGIILPKMKDRFVVGLFGDKLQSIYSSTSNPGIGELPPALRELLEPIIKPDNRRCPIAVINVLNRIRDDIQQVPAADNSQGEALYLFAQDEAGLESAQTFLKDSRGWSVTANRTKQLFLTHRLIAKRGGYGDLIQVYGDRGGYFREDFLGGEDRTISFFMDKVEALASAWHSANQGLTVTLLKNNGFQLRSNADKQVARHALDKLNELRETATVKEVLTHLRNSKLMTMLEDLEARLTTLKRDTSKMDEKDAEREVRDSKFYTELFSLPYTQIASFVDFFLNHTPFATKHGVKGAEFDEVIVVLDDKGARWTQYSFDKYLSMEDLRDKAERWKRSRNLFYVCCSRPRERLAVVDLGSRDKAKVENVRRIFGAANVLEIQ